MMEVKQNTPVDLNDLLTSSKISGTDEVDDAVIQDLSDRTPSLINCDIIKPNDESTVIEEVQNGNADMISLIKDIDEEVGVDLNAPVNSELEDALLAEDDVTPEVSDNKTIEPTLSTADDILAEKSETSNSTTSSTNVRDPGDDLDTLLSKINDIVEDCIEKEIENTPGPTMELDKPLQKEKEIHQETELNESVLEVEEENTTNDSKKLVEEDKSKISDDDHIDVGKTLDLNDETKNLLDIGQSLTNSDIEKTSELNDETEDLLDIGQSPTNNDVGKTSHLIDETENLLDIGHSLTNNNGGKTPDLNDETENLLDIGHSLINNDVGKSLDLNDETENLLDIRHSITPDLDFPLPTTDSEKKVEEETNNEKDKTEMDNNEAPLAETEVINDIEATQSKITDDLTDKNLILEKTEELKEEAVQDNKISSNSNEIVESVETPQPTDNDEKKSSLNADVETTNTPIRTAAEETDETSDKTSKQSDEINSNKETVVLENAENEDSDDEIVFYVDKPPEKEKPKILEDISLVAEEEADKKKEDISPDKKNAQDDDDVVLLLDDDDEELSIRKEQQNDKETCEKIPDEQTETSNISTSEKTETKEKDIVVDNSDNARDDFASDNTTEKEKSVSKTEATETPEETNSNCSSSSNLLQESKSIKTSVEETTPEDIEIEEEEDDGDVELIIGDAKEPESEKVDEAETAPPSKRIRLSEDGEQDIKKQEPCDRSEDVEPPSNNEKKQESLDTSEQENNSAATVSTLKRSHDVIELEADEKSNDSNEGCNKKPKTDLLYEKVNITLDDKQSEDILIVNEDKKDIKAVPSYEPIRLYPAPKLGVLKTELPMSLEYLKKFRKSFDNMTKQDLEELVLQKVVEAIIHKSEFSEMRELIEKQEKLISAHRTKISELSKQFRDLEMVHNRVVKDIEQRNSQFIMPVKITRAVGLQVYIPNKKSLAETTSNSISQSIPTSPQRPVSSQASSTSNTSLTPPQRHFVSSQTDSQPPRPVSTSSSVSGSAGIIRRGCVQKITPIRPVPGSSQSTSSGSSVSSSAPYRSTQTHSAPTQPRILNKNASNNQNATTLQRPRFGGPNQDGQRMPTQVSRPPNTTTNSQRVATNTAMQPKPTSGAAASVQRRSEPLPSPNSSNSATSIVDNYLNTITHLTGGNTAVSITPAKPKEKAVIDLTDEDEAPLQSTGVQPSTPTPGSQLQRRSLPAPNNTNTQIHGRAAPTMARIPPASQMANNKNRQMTSLQAQKNNSFSSISTPPGTSITRINVAPNNTNVQRVKYSHPAPLPATPPQAFNPSWKLPPPRPTIRISNLDNGIVISWTMEESMDRHAECVSYQIYAYQETTGPPMVDSWRHVGDVKAMLLPMAVTLTQFQEGQRYYFAVRAVDCHQRYGPFSLPKTWS